MNCNICDQKLKFILEPHKNKIGISSESKFLEVKLSKLFLCKKCYYFQKKTHQKKKNFYSKYYNLLMKNFYQDQILFVGKKKTFRAEIQRDIIVSNLKKNEKKILEVGCGKGLTAFKIKKEKNIKIDLVDEGKEKYIFFWNRYLKGSKMMKNISMVKKNNYSLAYSFFVLEHVQNPYLFIKKVLNTVEINGKAIFFVPDIEKNIGDLLTVDHLNHFSAFALECLALKIHKNFNYDFKVTKNERLRALNLTIFKKIKKKNTKKKFNLNKSLIIEKRIKDMWFFNLIDKKKIMPYENVFIWGSSFYGKLFNLKHPNTIMGVLDSNSHFVGRKFETLNKKKLIIKPPLSIEKISLPIILCMSKEYLSKKIIQKQYNKKNLNFVNLF